MVNTIIGEQILITETLTDSNRTRKPKAVYAEVNKNSINWYCKQLANDLIANSE